MGGAEFQIFGANGVAGIIYGIGSVLGIDQLKMDQSERLDYWPIKSL